MILDGSILNFKMTMKYFSVMKMLYSHIAKNQILKYIILKFFSKKL